MENQTNDFNNVIWTDETTVQLENHRRFSHRKRGEKPRPKPKYVTCSSLLTMGLSGGKHHQSLPISIPSRLSGMNTFVER
jgi:hypothetical protein